MFDRLPYHTPTWTLAEWIDECIQRQVQANPATWYSKVPKNLDSLYNSCRRPASKEGYSDTLRTKCSLREKSASFKAWDLEKQAQRPTQE